MNTSETPESCTIAWVGEGTTEPCPEDGCAYWEKGCVLGRVESELAMHPELAGLLLGLRRELEQVRLGRGRRDDDGSEALHRFHERLSVGRE